MCFCILNKFYRERSLFIPTKNPLNVKKRDYPFDDIRVEFHPKSQKKKSRTNPMTLQPEIGYEISLGASLGV